MKEVRGSITVFLTMVMVCILSLVGTMLDMARYEIADHLAYDTLVNAIDAELTNYCKEIYEDYKIFLLGEGQNQEMMSGEEYVDSICEYLTYTLEPKKEIRIQDHIIPLSTTDFLAIQLKSCTLKGQTMITDQEGEIFQHQVEEYMKYNVPAELAETLLSKLNLLQNTKTTMSVFRKKMEVEDEAAEISQSILNLITEVEGLSFDDGELEMTADHFIVIKDSFGKKFCTEKVGPKAVAINHNLVWDSLCNKYTNPLTVLSKIQNADQELLTLKQECSEIEEQLKTETDAENRIKLEGELEQRKTRTQELEDEVYKEGHDVVEQAKYIKEHLITAIEIIDGLKGKKESCERKLGEFEGYLNTEKEKLDDGSYKAVTEELGELKDYLYKVDESGVDTSIVGDVLAMRSCLATNLIAVELLADIAPLVNRDLTPDITQRETEIAKVITAFKSYTLRPLQFDYNQLNTEPKEDSPVDGLGGLIEDGITGLVLPDASQLSEQKITSTKLPSKMLGTITDISEEENKSDELANRISDTDGDSGDVSSSMEEYETICGNAEPEGSTVNDIARRVLLNAYGTSYFKSYATPLELKEEDARPNPVLTKDSYMQYEQEYLIMGGECDEENVKDIINRTVFIRTAMNYLALVTNSVARSEALAAATAMVGFTGCAPLVTIVKHVILMGWGFEEALVDVSALMQGKSVLLFKKADNFSVQFWDLPTINKAMIRQKVDSLPDDDSLLSLSYKDYLNFYMFMVGPDTLSLRMMDLIQENTRIRYDEDFYMQNGVFGMEISMEYEIPYRFINLPLIRQLTGNPQDPSSVEISTEYSY